MDLQAKLEQAQRDNNIVIVRMAKEIEDIEKQIADSEVTYSIGDRFKTAQEKVILVQVWSGVYKYAFARLSTGECWNECFPASDPERITKEEIGSIMGCLDRYWDARRQCKC